jgi:uncharacterized protein YecE (DUF72 family)
VIYVGTSGWQYASWKRRFYPEGLPQSSWLRFYASHFRTVEVNNTFYRLPARDTFTRWREGTPPGFVMTVKASRFITHIKRLKDPEEPVRTFFERAHGLGDKLGPVLFQLPPRFHADVERLARFLGALPQTTRCAFEFRDPTWDTPEVRRLLDDHGAALVLADRPGRRVEDVVTGGWSYLRFHQGQRIRPGYSRRKLRRWAQRIVALPARDVYVYFNNDPEGAAVADARIMTSLLIELGGTVAPAVSETAATRTG